MESLIIIDTYDVFISLERIDESRGNVVNGEDDLGDASLGECLNLVAEDGLVTEEHERLGDAESKGSQTSAVATDQN